jgi:hypothetical protein
MDLLSRHADPPAPRQPAPNQRPFVERRDGASSLTLSPS